MEKKQLYTAPAVREMDVRFDISFLQSVTGGPMIPSTSKSNP